jgi:hypothetical protein
LVCVGVQLRLRILYSHAVLFNSENPHQRRCAVYQSVCVAANEFTFMFSDYNRFNQSIRMRRERRTVDSCAVSLENMDDCQTVICDLPKPITLFACDISNSKSKSPPSVCFHDCLRSIMRKCRSPREDGRQFPANKFSQSHITSRCFALQV